MIQPLRTAHRWSVIALSVALPALVATALVARRPEPPALARAVLAPPYVLSDRGHVELKRRGANLYAVAHNDFPFPETLVYLSRTNAIDSQSRLLGVFDPQRTNSYLLTSETDEHVVFYSPVLSNIIDQASLAGAK